MVIPLVAYSLIIPTLILVQRIISRYSLKYLSRYLPLLFSLIILSIHLKQVLLLFFLITFIIFYSLDDKKLNFLPKNTSLVLAFLLMALIVAKTLQENMTSFIYPLGFSYFIFRLIHYVVEKRRNNLPDHNVFDLLSYLLFFPTFLAGPLERFPEHFKDLAKIQTHKNNFSPDEFFYGVGRILIGVIKKFFGANTLANFIYPVLNAPQIHKPYLIFLSVLGLSWQLYWDFSGYSDMAIGLSRCLGFKVRENFHWPFFKHNLAQHWRSWHISLHEWIRDYFFLPIFGTSWGRWDSAQLRIYLGTFCSMMIFHLWHGLNSNFLVMGVYHGLALTLWTLIQEKKRKSSFLKKLFPVKSGYLNNIFYGVLTYFYVSFGFIFFFFPLNHGLKIFSQLVGWIWKMY